MVGFRDNDDGSRDAQPRLETARAAGFRHGMSATSMIGSRLARVYDVTREMPREMGSLIRSLERGTSR